MNGKQVGMTGVEEPEAEADEEEGHSAARDGVEVQVSEVRGWEVRWWEYTAACFRLHER